MIKIISFSLLFFSGYKLLNDAQAFASNRTQVQIFENLQDNITSLLPEITRLVGDLNSLGLIQNGTLQSGIFFFFILLDSRVQFNN